MENIKKITARLKTAEEITGIKGCRDFHGDGWSYIRDMDKLAQTEQVIELQIADDNDNYGKYDYITKNTLFWVKKEWLKDIRVEITVEKIDWEKVPVNTKVIIRSEGMKGNRYFSHFKDGQLYCFPDGRTSWSHYGGTSLWSYNPSCVELWKGED